MTEDEPRSTLLAVLEDPSDGRRRLPYLVGLLDDDDEAVRIGAAWATCLVASSLPDTAEYLTRRLADRLRDDDPTFATELLFGYLASNYPETVAAELESIESEIADRPRFRSIEGTLSRANYHLPSVGDRDVGRTRFPDGESSVGTHRVHAKDTEREARPDRPEGKDGTEADASEDSEPAAPSGDAEGRSTDDGTNASGRVDDGRPDDVDGRDGGFVGESGWQPADELPAIVYRSRFDQLTVLAKRRRDRYGDVYRTLGVVDDEELGVALVLFHRPGERRAAFVEELTARLEEWAAVSAHDNVVTLSDWGVDPQPWAALEFTELSLADREALGTADVVRNARRLADAVEHLHDNGVVHGGIDPSNVVYYGNVLDESEQQPPLLTNVGLMHVVRRHFDPTTRLDPRYAAPEYFDRRYGRIDHATDGYQLGAVVYRLATGRAPYEGDYESVRRAVLDEEAPRPSAVADVPAGIDAVVTKAMAREKLHRYETVTHLAQELRGIGAE